jgi:caffeoyl-CoA O-methyltransferase
MPPKPKFTALDDALYDYLLAHRSPDDDVVRDLREETARLGSQAVMQISPDQATFLRLLVAATGARRAVEVGTFTGFSSLAIARGLPADGRLLCLDVSEEWTSIARRAWVRAGVADRIELRIAPAAETLRALPEEPVFDFAFIDADKKGYPVYWEEIVRRTRPGGLIAVDNVLWEGEVVRPEEQNEDAVAIRHFNELVLRDTRVESVMLAIADGLTLARRLATSAVRQR